LKKTKLDTHGTRFHESVKINAGLLALANVIRTLSERSGKDIEMNHIPYRQSKLTRFLQDSLGGCTYTLMIACISPYEADFQESANTVAYASRAKVIRNNPKRIQEAVFVSVHDGPSTTSTMPPPAGGGKMDDFDTEDQELMDERPPHLDDVWFQKYLAVLRKKTIKLINLNGNLSREAERCKVLGESNKDLEMKLSEACEYIEQLASFISEVQSKEQEGAHIVTTMKTALERFRNQLVEQVLDLDTLFQLFQSTDGEETWVGVKGVFEEIYNLIITRDDVTRQERFEFQQLQSDYDQLQQRLDALVGPGIVASESIESLVSRDDREVSLKPTEPDEGGADGSLANRADERRAIGVASSQSLPALYSARELRRMNRTRSDPTLPPRLQSYPRPINNTGQQHRLTPTPLPKLHVQVQTDHVIDFTAALSTWLAQRLPLTSQSAYSSISAFLQEPSEEALVVALDAYCRHPTDLQNSAVPAEQSSTNTPFGDEDIPVPLAMEVQRPRSSGQCTGEDTQTSFHDPHGARNTKAYDTRLTGNRQPVPSLNETDPSPMDTPSGTDALSPAVDGIDPITGETLFDSTTARNEALMAPMQAKIQELERDNFYYRQTNRELKQKLREFVALQQKQSEMLRKLKSENTTLRQTNDVDD
jgi:hypothetical protein